MVYQGLKNIVQHQFKKNLNIFGNRLSGERPEPIKRSEFGGIDRISPKRQGYSAFAGSNWGGSGRR